MLLCAKGRKISIGNIGGQILVNGYPKVQKTFAHVEGYVEDLMSYPPYMTVREGIAFSAAMRLGKKSPFQKREVFIEEVNRLYTHLLTGFSSNHCSCTGWVFYLLTISSTF